MAFKNRKWAVQTGLTQMELVHKVKSEIANGTSFEKIADMFNTTQSTMVKFAKDFCGYKSYPRGEKYKNYDWMLGDEEEMNKLIHHLFIVEDMDFKDLAKALGAKETQLQHYIYNKTDIRKEPKKTSAKRTIIKRESTNRIFSIYVIGSNPKALDRIRNTA